MLSSPSLLLTIFLFLSGFVIADVQVVSPKTDDEFSGSSGTVSIEVKWMDNGADPALDDIKFYSFTLETGPNNDIEKVKTLKAKVDPADVTLDSEVYSYKLEFDASIAGDGQYYIQVYTSVDGKNSYTNNYSPRFTLSSMKGTSTYSFTDTTQPNGETVIHQSSSASVDTKSFTLHYTQQTGVSRFAPMQMQPGSKITATTWTRKFPTSAVTYYSTLRNTLAQETTLTPGWSYTLPSGFNRATPAAYPTDNGGWHDPKERQKLSTRKINLKKRANRA